MYANSFNHSVFQKRSNQWICIAVYINQLIINVHIFWRLIFTHQIRTAATLKVLIIAEKATYSVWPSFQFYLVGDEKKENW